MTNLGTPADLIH